MAQAFATTYQKYHRQHKIDRRKSLRPVDRLADEVPEGDLWIIRRPIEDDEGGVGLAAAEEAVHSMLRRRLWSTYQVEYCKALVPKKSTSEKEAPSENAILLYGEALYGPRTQKIAPPLPSSRRIYGYIRPKRMYFPITTFQAVHGKVGHDVLVKNNAMAKKQLQEANAKAS